MKKYFSVTVFSLSVSLSILCGAPTYQTVRCVVRSADLISSSMELSTHGRTMHVTWLGDRINVNVTRAFKELGLISKFEEVQSLDAHWKEDLCFSTSLKSGYHCTGKLDTEGAAYVALYKDSKGMIHERVANYPKGFHVSLRGTLSGWEWKFSLESNFQTYEVVDRLHSCEYREYAF